MSTFVKPLLSCLLAGLVCVSCTKEDQPAATPLPDNTVLTMEEQITIAKAGFSPTGAIKQQGAYLVEGDMLLTAAALQRMAGKAPTGDIHIARTEHYRTTHLVGPLPGMINIAVEPGPAEELFKAATDTAITRYNELKLNISFKRVNAPEDADIVIAGARLGIGILGVSAGFPDSSGRPAPLIQLNTNYFMPPYNDTPALASVLTHELGHAIGFRHTDYMDRSFSCGRTLWYDFLQLLGLNAYDEGSSDIGAIHIQGTPSGPDAVSWMLACGGGGNRPFNENDVKALKAVY